MEALQQVETSHVVPESSPSVEPPPRAPDSAQSSDFPTWLGFTGIALGAVGGGTPIAFGVHGRNVETDYGQVPNQEHW